MRIDYCDDSELRSAIKFVENAETAREWSDYWERTNEVNDWISAPNWLSEIPEIAYSSDRIVRGFVARTIDMENRYINYGY